jgi:hypothetical protein
LVELYLMCLSEADKRCADSSPGRFDWSSWSATARSRPSTFPTLERELEDGTIDIIKVKKWQEGIDQDHYDRRTELV